MPDWLRSCPASNEDRMFYLVSILLHFASGSRTVPLHERTEHCWSA